MARHLLWPSFRQRLEIWFRTHHTTRPARVDTVLFVQQLQYRVLSPTDPASLFGHTNIVSLEVMGVTRSGVTGGFSQEEDTDDGGRCELVIATQRKQSNRLYD